MPKKQCLETGCGQPIWARNKCKYHDAVSFPEKYAIKRTSRGKPKPRKRIPIKPISDKRKIQNEEYKVVRLEYLKEHPNCEAGLQGCAKKAGEIHHKIGRIGHRLTDKEHFLALCRNCHTRIELDPIMAKERGFSLNRIN